MQYGVDIASTRLDDLDKRVISSVEAMVAASKRPRLLDVGCGQGGLTVALAVGGASVVALDINDYEESINERLKTQGLSHDTVNFIEADIREWLKSNTESFDRVVLQRVLHYLKYTEAIEVLTQLRSRTSHLFVAVSGLNTAIGEHYVAGGLPVGERWGKLDTAGQEKFSITAPLCLYTESELRELLMKTGWQIEWLRVSDFGNIKVEVISNGR